MFLPVFQNFFGGKTFPLWDTVQWSWTNPRPWFLIKLINKNSHYDKNFSGWVRFGGLDWCLAWILKTCYCISKTLKMEGPKIFRILSLLFPFSYKQKIEMKLHRIWNSNPSFLPFVLWCMILISHTYVVPSSSLFCLLQSLFSSDHENNPLPKEIIHTRIPQPS